MTIPIRNLYFIFCYAWSRFPPGDVVDRGVDESPDLPNLLARMLIASLNRLIRRGIDRGYIVHEEETRAPRGQLCLTKTIKQQTLRRGAVICAYDDLTEDVLHNQILKATAKNLSCATNLEPSFAHDLRSLNKRFRYVSDISLSPSTFSRVQLSRNSKKYRPLLRLCALIHESLMPDESGRGGTRFADIQSDDAKMSKVFEEFLRNFYAHEQDTYSVNREMLQWRAKAADRDALRYLPHMHTDITLSTSSEKIVIDAKYYKKALSDRFEQKKVHSTNLYQLYAYLRHTVPPKDCTAVSGVLIYPSTYGDDSIEFVIDGFPIKIEIVDLDRPWPSIKRRLLSLIPQTEWRSQAGSIQKPNSSLGTQISD